MTSFASGGASGVPSGSADTFWTPTGNAILDTLAIASFILSNKTVWVTPGSAIKLTNQLVVHATSKFALDSVGRYTIAQDASWAATGTTTANGLFLFEEVESGTSTTVNGTVAMGRQTLTLASATNFANGSRFKSVGLSPGGSDYYGQSAGTSCPALEVLQVDTLAGAVATLVKPLRTHQGTGKTLKLLSSVCDHIRISNADFDLSTGPFVAYAFAATYVDGVEIVNCTIKGAAHVGVYLQGCKNFRIDRIRNRGGTNTVFEIDSCQDGRVTGEDAIEDLNQRAPTAGGSAAVWGRWWVHSQSVNIDVDYKSEFGVCGAMPWGGRNNRFRGTQSDMFPDAIYTAPRIDSGRRGSWFDQGGNALAWAEFGFGNSFRFQAEMCFSGSSQYITGSTESVTNYRPLGYFHDQYEIQDSCVLYDSKGNAFDTTGFLSWVGIAEQDCGGYVAECKVQGALWGMGWSGASPTIRFGSFVFAPGAGSGTASGGAPLIATECTQGCGSFGRIECQSIAEFALFEASFAPPTASFQFPLIDYAQGPLIALTGNNTVFFARNVMLAKWPDSTAIGNGGVAWPIDSTATTGVRTMASAQAASSSNFAQALVLSVSQALAGVKRYGLVVELGPGAAAPIIVAASASTIRARTAVEVNSSGNAIPISISAAADWQKNCGALMWGQAGDSTARVIQLS